VLDQKVLVLKLGSVDRLTPCSVKPLKVAALQHELGDDPVEDGALVRETLLVLPGGDRYKICHSSGNNLIEHFKINDSIVFVVSRNSELNL